MSCVTNVILSVGLNDVPKSLKEWCNDNILFWPKTNIDSVSGGTKHMECHVYCWGANYLSKIEFMKQIAETEWERPEHIQLMLMDEEEDIFTLYQLTANGKWINVSGAREGYFSLCGKKIGNYINKETKEIFTVFKEHNDDNVVKYIATKAVTQIEYQLTAEQFHNNFVKL